MNVSADGRSVERARAQLPPRTGSEEHTGNDASSLSTDGAHSPRTTGYDEERTPVRAVDNQDSAAGTLSPHEEEDALRQEQRGIDKTKSATKDDRRSRETSPSKRTPQETRASESSQRRGATASPQRTGESSGSARIVKPAKGMAFEVDVGHVKRNVIDESQWQGKAVTRPGVRGGSDTKAPASTEPKTKRTPIKEQQQHRMRTPPQTGSSSKSPAAARQTVSAERQHGAVSAHREAAARYARASPSQSPMRYSSPKAAQHERVVSTTNTSPQKSPGTISDKRGASPQRSAIAQQSPRRHAYTTSPHNPLLAAQEEEITLVVDTGEWIEIYSSVSSNFTETNRAQLQQTPPSHKRSTHFDATRTSTGRSPFALDDDSPSSRTRVRQSPARSTPRTDNFAPFYAGGGGSSRTATSGIGTSTTPSTQVKNNNTSNVTAVTLGIARTL